MKSYFFKLAMMFFILNIQNSFTGEIPECSTDSLYQAGRQCYESILLTSLEDLYFDQGNIILNVEGNLRQVDSLQRVGNQWVAIVGDPIVYCPKGHVCCKYCHQCHISWCSYYVRPCKQWDR